MPAVLVLIGVLFSSGVMAASCAQYNTLWQQEQQLSEEEQMELIWEDDNSYALLGQAYGALEGSADLAAIERSHQRLRELYQVLKRGYSSSASRTYTSMGVQSGCASRPDLTVEQVLADVLKSERARLEKKILYVEQKVEVKDLPTIRLD